MKIKLIKSWEERKKRKERIDMQSQIEVDKEDLYTLNINCKGKRIVRKANKKFHVLFQVVPKVSSHFFRVSSKN